MRLAEPLVGVSRGAQGPGSSVRWWMVLFALVTTAWPSPTQLARVSAVAPKWVEVDKTRQTLRAYEGTHVVLESRVSTGRWDKSTPNGDYHVGDKQLLHFSSLYHNAAMPYSVQVVGNVFIHGFTIVPMRPASHGCIRLPLDGANPAKRFFEWVEVGTPVRITGQWKDR